MKGEHTVTGILGGANKRRIVAVASAIVVAVVCADFARAASEVGKSRLSMASSVSYRMQSDLADEREPRVLTHRMDGALSATFNQRTEPLVTASLAIGGESTTVGPEIEERSGHAYEMTDVDFALSREFRMNDLGPAKSSLDAVVGNYFPTSEATRYEGIKSIPYSELEWTLGFRGGLANVVQAFGVSYTINSFSHSPTTREINSDLHSSYALGLNLRLGRGFSILIGGKAGLTHAVDDTVTSSLSNSQALSWSTDAFRISLRHMNGIRPGDRQDSLWFVDDYRRLVSLAATARF